MLKNIWACIKSHKISSFIIILLSVSLLCIYIYLPSLRSLIVTNFLNVTIICMLSSYLFKTIISNYVAQKFEKYRSQIKLEESRYNQKWLIKKDACLKALDISNRIYTHRFPIQGIGPEDVSSAETRNCFNILSASLDGGEVFNIFQKIAFDTGWKGDLIIDLRNAVRKELFGQEVEIEKDREKAFLGAFSWEIKG